MQLSDVRFSVKKRNYSLSCCSRWERDRPREWDSVQLCDAVGPVIRRRREGEHVHALFPMKCGGDTACCPPNVTAGDV